MFFSPHIIIQIFAILFDQHEWLTTQNETHIGAKKNHIAYIIFEKTHYSENRFLNQSFKHKNHNLKSQKNKKKHRHLENFWPHCGTQCVSQSF